MPPAGKMRNSLYFGLLLALALNLWPLPAFGRTSAEENILIFWTEKDRLKAVTLMCLQGPQQPVGIVAIPVFIDIDPGPKPSFTIAEAYGRLGRQGLTARLEDLFQLPIGSYVAVDQSTLEKASALIGPLVMEGKVTSLAEVFEGTYTSGAIEPQSEIRHLAARLVEPQVLAKAPHLVYILTTEVKTNLGCKSLWSIYRAVEQQGPGILNKKALTGRDYYVDNRVYRVVPPETWVSVLNEVIRA